MPLSIVLSAFLLLSGQQVETQVSPKTFSDKDAKVVCPQMPKLYGAKEVESWFEGTFGTHPVRLHLDRSDDHVIGTFYSPEDWRGHNIGGRWSADDSIQMGVVTEMEGELSLQDGLKAKLVGKEIVGTWKLDGSSAGVPVHLHETPRLVCDGRGPQKPFSDKRWPVEFSYPADWHLEATDTEITLTCPDPSWMAYDDVKIHLTKASSGELPVQRCGNRWIFTDGKHCDDLARDSSAQQEATVTTRNGITRFSGWEMGHRLYCQEGGYIGQGEGEDEVLRVGDVDIELHASQLSDAWDKIVMTMKKRP